MPALLVLPLLPLLSPTALRHAQNAGYRRETIIRVRKVVDDNTNNGGQGFGGALI